MAGNTGYVGRLGALAAKGTTLDMEAEKPLTVRTTPEELPDACMACVQEGGVFDSAFGFGGKNGKTEVAYLFHSKKAGGPVLFVAEGREFSAVSAWLNAALWDERKMQDIHGIQFDGISDGRPIVNHPENGNATIAQNVKANRKLLPKPTVADYHISGTGAEGEFEIPVGPVHAGIIEPGHFRFFVSGEAINRMEARMSYLHRGLERAARGRRFSEAVPLLEQVSGDEPVANTVTYCQAVEGMAGAQAPRKAESIRLVLMEMERFYSHLADLGGIATDVGFNAASAPFAALREDAMRLNLKVSGNRFLKGICAVGGLSRGLEKEALKEAAKTLPSFAQRLSEIEELALSSSTFLDRVFSAGKVPQATAEKLALVGPVARASGVSCDLRKHYPYGAYRRARFSEAIAAGGDVLCRFNVKANEAREALLLAMNELEALHGGGAVSTPVGKAKEGSFGIGMCEAPRGACTVAVKAGRNGTIGEMAIRTASFRNWRGLEKAVEGNIVPDFPLINKSFNLSYAGADL